MAFFVVEGLTLIGLYGCLARLIGFDFSSGYLLVEIMVAAGFLLFTFVGLSRGKLWAVKLFRWSTHAFAVACPVIIAYSLFIYARRPEDSALAVILLVLAVFQLPAFFVIYRSFARVRWLDPVSLPSEWEPPARSTNPRVSDGAPVKPGIPGWLFLSVLGLAVMLRYYIGLIRSNWVGEWLGSGNVLQEAAALIAIPGPFLVIGITLWLNRRARLRRRVSE